MNALNEWARRNQIPTQALLELTQLLADSPSPPIAPDPISEAAVQSHIRLDAPRLGAPMWRNNVGAAMDDDGVPIRYGLANDSSKLNKRVKSSDLIGLCPIFITPAWVGHTVGAFVAVECKRADWKWGGSDRERAQQRFHNIVRAAGGRAGFARSVPEFREILGVAE